MISHSLDSLRKRAPLRLVFNVCLELCEYRAPLCAVWVNVPHFRRWKIGRILNRIHSPTAQTVKACGLHARTLIAACTMPEIFTFLSLCHTSPFWLNLVAMFRTLFLTPSKLAKLPTFHPTPEPCNARNQQKKFQPTAKAKDHGVFSPCASVRASFYQARTTHNTFGIFDNFETLT